MAAQSEVPFVSYHAYSLSHENHDYNIFLAVCIRKEKIYFIRNRSKSKTSLVNYFNLKK